MLDYWDKFKIQHPLFGELVYRFSLWTVIGLILALYSNYYKNMKQYVESTGSWLKILLCVTAMSTVIFFIRTLEVRHKIKNNNRLLLKISKITSDIALAAYGSGVVILWTIALALKYVPGTSDEILDVCKYLLIMILLLIVLAISYIVTRAETQSVIYSNSDRTVRSIGIIIIALQFAFWLSLKA